MRSSETWPVYLPHIIWRLVGGNGETRRTFRFVQVKLRVTMDLLKINKKSARTYIETTKFVAQSI